MDPNVCTLHVMCWWFISWFDFCYCPVLQDGETAVILAAQKGHKELLLRLVNHYKCAAREKDNVSS